SIDLFGGFTDTPAGNAIGTSAFVVTAQDAGGTDNGGVDTSDPQTFTITVTGINDAPSFMIGAEETVGEDAGAQTVSDFASGFDPGPNEDGASTDSQVLQDEGADGTMNPFSTDHMNPTDLGSLAHGSNVVRGFIDAASTVGDVDVFTFQIEDGFQLDGLFVLDYDYITPPANSNERNAFLGINDAATFPYDVNGLDINSNSSFDETLFLGGTVFGLDDSPTANILPRAGVVTGRKFSGPLPAGTYTFYIQQTGPANTYSLDLQVTEITKQSAVTYTVSNLSNTELFAVAPTIDREGTLTYTAADDVSGTATFDVVVQDDGGTDNSGVDTSTTVVGTITVSSVNDAPSFMAMDPATVIQDSGEQTLAGFASGFSPGPADEAGQTVLGYSLTNVSNTGLFSAGPAIDINGDLTYTPADGVVGSSTFDLSVQDSGGTANNGVDVSETQTFTINVIEALSVTWADPEDMIVGVALSSVQLNATANVAGSFVYTPAAGTVLAEGDGQVLSVTFTPEDMAFAPITETVTINVVAAPTTNDFGDAPVGFPVLLADDGARHGVGSLFLGANVDVEADGQPSAASNADGIDEDGVFQVTDLIAAGGVASTASLQVQASEAGLLDAWIDFNGDGDWMDAGEQIATSLSVSAGNTVVSFVIPGEAIAGSQASRFRLSTAGGLSPTGAAQDGEVEDHLIPIMDGQVSPAVDVILPEVAAVVLQDAGELVVRGSNGDLFRIPTDRIGSLNVLGTGADDMITVDVTGGPIEPLGGLNLLGNGGSDTLRVVGTAEVDLVTTGAIVAQGFSTIDLSDSTINTIRISAAAVRLLSSANSVGIVGGEDDVIILDDLASWRMGDVLIIDGRFIRNLVTTSGLETLQTELPNAWQNVVLVNDVNNSGDITAGDALRIINELARREFSDPDSQDLQDPLNVASWPGVYFDQNGDNRATALDALRVINELSRLSLGGEEAEQLVPQAAATDQAMTDLLETAGVEVGRNVEKLLGDFDLPAGDSASEIVVDSQFATEESTSEEAVDELLATLHF
ncbi:MAG: GEVED domain-containing protein, partial [Rubripirellula sp.]